MWRPQGAQLPRSGISHFRLDPALGHRQCLELQVTDMRAAHSSGWAVLLWVAFSSGNYRRGRRYDRSRQCATRYDNRRATQIQVFSSPPKLLTGNNSSLSCGASKRERLAEYKAEPGGDRERGSRRLDRRSGCRPGSIPA